MLEFKTINSISVARFNGVQKFNVTIVPQVKEQLNGLLSNTGMNVILDLEGIRFLDSSAFGALISILKTAKMSKSTFKLCNPTSEVKEMIAIMQLNTVFEVYDSLDMCIKSFSYDL